MKELNELLEMVKGAKNTDGSKNGNFLSYNYETKKVWLHNDYESAKRHVERGGQVLVIDKQKVYTYKVKNDEEYENYLRYNLLNERRNMMNKYGL